MKNQLRLPTKQYTTRYTAYASAHGKTPDEMLEYDVEAWPGGKMCGFMLWIQERWNEWHAMRGLRRFGGKDGHVLTDNDHADFDAWLVERQQRQAA